MVPIDDISEKVERFDQASRLERLQSPQMIQKTKAVRYPLLCPIHKAYCKTNASAATTIDCYLDVDETGPEIEVHCNVFGGGYLDSAFPELFDGDMIKVQKDGDEWWCIWWFNGYIECEYPT